MKIERIPVVFTPANEPYLRRKLFYHFDQLICSAMEQNAATAPRSNCTELTNHQRMASQVIPQALSITLSIRELIRQDYLFGAHVLACPLVECTAILLHLHPHPEEIDRWNQGRHYRDGPRLAKMPEAIHSKRQNEAVIHGVFVN